LPASCFIDPSPPSFSTLSLHDALPIFCVAFSFEQGAYTAYDPEFGGVGASVAGPAPAGTVDRLLAEVGPDVFLLDLRDAAGSAVEPWFLAPRRFRAVGAVAVHDAGSFAPATLGEEFDGAILVRR